MNYDQQKAEAEKLLTDARATVANNPNLCNCATCAEAYTTAMSMVEKNAEYQCDQWMLQVAYAIIGISKARLFEYAMEQGASPPMAYMVAASADDQSRKVMFAHALVNNGK